MLTIFLAYTINKKTKTPQNYLNENRVQFDMFIVYSIELFIKLYQTNPLVISITNWYDVLMYF